MIGRDGKLHIPQGRGVESRPAETGNRVLSVFNSYLIYQETVYISFADQWTSKQWYKMKFTPEQYHKIIFDTYKLFNQNIPTVSN